MDTQENLLPESPERMEEPAEKGEVLFETSVAMKGGVLTIELVATSTGTILQMQATGGLRKPAPMKLDRYQATALVAALRGAGEAMGV